MGPDLILDLDCFFASVEQQLDPRLRGRPVAVVPVKSDSTSCIAASKEAKRCGVKTGTRVRDARQLCPDIILVESRPRLYTEYHQRFVTALESRIQVAEVMSIDEAWCLLPKSVNHRTQAEAFARSLKATLTSQVGDWLTYSIGIAPNRFLAKLASDMAKPDGLFMIEQADLPHCLHRLKLRDFCGIGQKMETRLVSHGIRTVAQLTSATRETLHHVWGGIGGVHLWHWLRGEVTETPPTQRRTIGHSHVLPTRLRNDLGTHAVVCRLLQKAAMRLRKMGSLHLSPGALHQVHQQPHLVLRHLLLRYTGHLPSAGSPRGALGTPPPQTGPGAQGHGRQSLRPCPRHQGHPQPPQL
ncbi:hypothetical protein [Verrucomicrobium sp. BvORR106]|uniref:DNA polymerase Y family protein n=1 Tax=Verrucomicrobium sp. BvORR106 TaxID=1403819 RepID=UPI0006910DFC|nr:hypothetical protein [Verrucomicrobium sp. BvORR106]